MATTENEKVSVTGLDQADNRKEAEYDLLTSLLEAAEYKTSEENITEVEIKRNGKFLFSVHLHPISETDIRFARKQATVKDNGKRRRNLPKIEKTDDAIFNSWIIYLATTDEDQTKIWGNKAVMQKYNLMQNYECIDILLKAGEKSRVADIVLDISGFNDEVEDEDEVSTEDFR